MFCPVGRPLGERRVHKARREKTTDITHIVPFSDQRGCCRWKCRPAIIGGWHGAHACSSRRNTAHPIAPRNSINYFDSVVSKMGGLEKAEESVRLFMVPGMGHCSGGEGPNRFDRPAAGSGRRIG